MAFSPGIAGLAHNITDAVPLAKPAGQIRRGTTTWRMAISITSILADELSENETSQAQHCTFWVGGDSGVIDVIMEQRGENGTTAFPGKS
jgi:hypothetical protein